MLYITKTKNNENQINFSKGKESFIYIDENISGVDKMLLEAGVENVYMFPDGTKDLSIHQSICQKHKRYNPQRKEQKPVLFVSKDYDDFLNFPNRKYTIIGFKPDIRNESIFNVIMKLIYNDIDYLRNIMKNDESYQKIPEKYILSSNPPFRFWNSRLRDEIKRYVQRFLRREEKKSKK